MTGKPETIDSYLDGLSDVKRAALGHLRRSIKALLPEAEECMSCQLPAFRFKGEIPVGQEFSRFTGRVGKRLTKLS